MDDLSDLSFVISFYLYLGGSGSKVGYTSSTKTGESRSTKKFETFELKYEFIYHT